MEIKQPCSRPVFNSLDILTPVNSLNSAVLNIVYILKDKMRSPSLWFCLASQSISSSLQWHVCLVQSDQKNKLKFYRISQTYPKVLINPLTEPSAYREAMSPICRKLDILSDISHFTFSWKDKEQYYRPCCSILKEIPFSRIPKQMQKLNFPNCFPNSF